MSRRVLIVGAGPSGLVTALALQQTGFHVTVLERESQIGGRAPGPASLDLVWGWQQQSLALLHRLTSDHVASPAIVRLLRPDDRRVAFPGWVPGRARVPAIALFRGLPVQDRWRLLNHLERRWEQAETSPSHLDGQSASAWLDTLKQSPASRRQVWEPVGRFLLGDTLGHLSAAAFAHALITSFLTSRRHSRLWIDPGRLRYQLALDARRTLEQAGAKILEKTAAEQIRCDQQGVVGVQVSGGALLTADWYVLAIPWHALTPLLPERALTRFSYFHHLDQLCSVASTTVTVRGPAARCRPEVLLVPGGPFHTVIVRPATEEIAATLIATGAVLERDDAELRQMAHRELARLYPRLVLDPQRSSEVGRHPEAALALRPGTAALRPLAQSPFRNCFLAGSWTDTGLLPGLESALVSGERCAQLIRAKP